MKIFSCTVLAVAMLAMPSLAQTVKPPQVTWDWWRAGEIYKKGYTPGSQRDQKIASRYYRKAAEMGNDSAAYALAEMYENGIGVKQNYAEAIKWYREAANAGNKYAQFRVGWFYEQGLGVRKNMAEAARWYIRSAAKDNEWAYHMLGFMLADGNGVRKDLALARKYLEISVPRTNDDWGKWKLATLIRSQDPGRSRKLLREAAAAGNLEARKALRETRR